MKTPEDGVICLKGGSVEPIYKAEQARTGTFLPA